MSNKLAKTRAQLERDTERDAARPSFRSSANYRVRYRHLSPDTLPRLQAVAKTALASERPELPTQHLEVGPNEWRDVENPHDEGYQKALEEWEAKVEQEAGARFLTLCEEYALIYEIDADEVAALRAAHNAIGDPLDDLSDAQVFLWKIALPTPEDQLTLYAKLFGGLTEEAIQAQKQTFLGNLQGALAPQSA